MTERPAGGVGDETFRRLGVWNVTSWRHGDRERHARTALDQLGRLASRADGIRRPAVPDVGIHALVDQLDVLTADAVEAGAPVEDIDAVLAALVCRLGLR